MEAQALSRIGHLSIKKQSSLLEHCISECERLGIRFEYDLNNINSPSILSAAEFLSQKDGLYIGPLDDMTKYQMIARAYIETKETKPIESFISGDKYNQIPYIGEDFKTVVILPGDNIFNTVVSQISLEAIAIQGDYVVKPHPISCTEFLEWIDSKFNTVSGLYSAYDLVDRSERVAITGTSELFIYAILKDKYVVDIALPAHGHDGGYTEMFKYTMSFPPEKRKEVILSILSNWKSGCCFSKEDVTAYLEYFKEEYL